MTEVLMFFVYWAMVLTPCILGLYIPLQEQAGVQDELAMKQNA